MDTRSIAVWDRLAALADYPDARFITELRACEESLLQVSPCAAAHLRAFAESLAGVSVARQEELYVESFDLDPQCSLNLTWHVAGDEHLRGAMMAGLRDDLRRAGVPDTAELPDHLTRLLALFAREDDERAGALGSLIRSGVAKVQEALGRRRSPYVHLLRAIDHLVASNSQSAERTLP
jgi:nitrate reductase delta subunit